MTTGTLELPSLYVEGKTDLYTIQALLARHGIELDKTTGPVVIKESKNDEGVLSAMSPAAKASTNRSVGFVIDADVPVTDRWRAVIDRLRDVELELPAEVPRGGFIGESAMKAKVGVWIMPDNRMDYGQLEHLVQTLVPDDDDLFDHAQKSTKEALDRGAEVREQDVSKAELHCWLAWQKEPGCPFGTAIKAHFLNHDSPTAMAFVAWFRALFPL